jgi:hypothetical protein
MAPIFFQFDDMGSAARAADTLQELGFRTRPILRVAMHAGDLTSALEIAQASGGTLAELTEEHRAHAAEMAVFNSAYGLDNIPVPAHVVTEDLPENYMHPGDGGVSYAANSLLEAVVSADLAETSPEAGGGRETTEPRFDPSGDDYNRMTPGVPS